LNLVNRGIITKQDAMAKAQDKNAFGAMGRI
jgi:twitching motility protein PilT